MLCPKGHTTQSLEGVGKETKPNNNENTQRPRRKIKIEGGDLSQRVITEAAFFRPRSSLLNLNFRDQYIRFARMWQENNEGKNLTSQVFYG